MGRFKQSQELARSSRFEVGKTLLIDVLPELEKNSIWTAEKLEGFAVAADGEIYVVTDNDGVDDAPGERSIPSGAGVLHCSKCRSQPTSPTWS